MSKKSKSIWNELNRIYSEWGLSEIPFTESANTLNPEQVSEVFTGREDELREALRLFQSRGRKRLLVYGWAGIGKTAFIMEVLGVLRENLRKSLVVYMSIPPQAQLATAALIGLARNMPTDEWAQHQLNQMGLRPIKRPVEKETEIGAGIDKTGITTSEKSIPVSPPQYPALSFEGLLERAHGQYEHVVIAIDDLDKQDPAKVSELLRDAQGMLKGGASFILTGHPYGLTRDFVSDSLGLFDARIELKPLDQDTSYLMLINYLNSARSSHDQREAKDPKAVWPFTPDTARQLCQLSNGIPRLLNRLGRYVLIQAAEQKAENIDDNVLRGGLRYANQQSRTCLTAEDQFVLNIVLEKGTLSDENITLAELEQLKVKTFNELLPVLEKLIQLDLVRRLPSGREAAFKPTAIVIEETS